MHPALERVEHRPWPLPKAPWVARQVWKHLLFAHWPVPAQALRPLVPRGLDIDEFDGTSWVGLVPFQIEDAMVRGLPALPYASNFAEMNLRLYVRRRDKPGVWFVSMDANKVLAVVGGRCLFLPYFWARMSVDLDSDRAVHYQSQRMLGGSAAFAATYRPRSAVFEPRPSTLEAFLTERYCLYTAAPGGSLLRMQIHHQPWPLRAATAEIRRNTVAAAHGITLPPQAPLLHFCARQDVIIWAPERA